MAKLYGKTKKQNENSSKKKTILINPLLKELTEFLSDLFPVLGAIFLIIVSLVQFWYSVSAENFYGIDKSLFYSENLIYFIIFAIITLGFFILIFISYFKLYTAEKIGMTEIFSIIIIYLGTMIVPVLVLIIKNPNLICDIILFVLSLIIPIADIVSSVIYKPKSKTKYYICKIIFYICKIIFCIAFLYSVYIYINITSKSMTELKRDYEIATLVDSNNTDWYYGSKNNDSHIFDIVILRGDSQVLLMKGKIEKARLTLYKGVYTFQDIDKFVYVKMHFEDVISIESYSSVVSSTEVPPTEVSPSVLTNEILN
ncbi:hypothetical protein [Oribacterium sinus]|uniref:hypothetical protein n=1 Tax=Oribacterium sinus TaxID=237576 RepID=UPI0028EDE21B|nr:hypothetical protein [Oribacterium sinus]